MSLTPPDIRELRALVDWVNVTDDIRELSIKYGDVELFVSRNRMPAVPAGASALAPAAPVASPAQVTVSAPVTVPEAPAAPIVATFPPQTVGDLGPNDVVIKAPMVGVFYAAPKPGDAAFVTVGATVTPSTVLGIVEVMKLMNNIEAQIDGTVKAILVENEKPVEFGQPLMVITRHG